MRTEDGIACDGDIDRYEKTLVLKRDDLNLQAVPTYSVLSKSKCLKDLGRNEWSRCGREKKALLNRAAEAQRHWLPPS